MKTDTAPQVLRFPLAIAGLSKVEIPKGAVILDVQPSKTGFNLFAMADPSNSKLTRTFTIVGTGQDLPHGWDWVHLRTFATQGPTIHVFEIPTHIAKKLGK
jgi:hypothetical protein